MILQLPYITSKKKRCQIFMSSTTSFKLIRSPTLVGPCGTVWDCTVVHCRKQISTHPAGTSLFHNPCFLVYQFVIWNCVPPNPPSQFLCLSAIWDKSTPTLTWSRYHLIKFNNETPIIFEKKKKETILSKQEDQHRVVMKMHCRWLSLKIDSNIHLMVLSNRKPWKWRGGYWIQFH